jgi:alkylation response protein AidB-like acyl-CoA dehydrogenase
MANHTQHTEDVKKTPAVEQEDSVVLNATTNVDAKTRAALEVTEEARDTEYLNPSFGAQLFMGHFDPSLLYPFPFQSEEDKKIGDEYIEKIVNFLKENLDPDQVDTTHEIPKKVIDGLVKLGAFAIKIPKEYNGLGFSQTNYNRIIMAVSSYCGATAVLLSAHQSIGVPQPLKMFGTEAQKKKWLPKFREGLISAFALTEPDVGSDPAQMSTEAKLSEDGSYYILNGDKLWCTNGVVADVIVVMAKTAPKMVKGKERKQISAFILDMKTPGIELVHRCEFMGLKGIYNGLLRFKDVKIPKENLLIAEGRGLAMALATINVGRLTLPAACLGCAKQALAIARDWGTERVQWGQPVGNHEAGRDKMAFIAANTFAIEAITYLTSSWQDLGNIDIRIEAAMAKLFSTEVLWKITDALMQLRGGRVSLKARGEKPYPVERMMRDTRINMILEGSTEIMHLFLAREAIDPHLKLAGNLLNKKSGFSDKMKSVGKILKFYSKWYPKQYFFTDNSYKDLGELAEYFQFVNSYAHVLARKIIYYMGKYQQNLEKKQLILARLVDIGTLLFVMAATTSYAKGLVDKKPGDKTPIDLAHHFNKSAIHQIKHLFHELDDNVDRSINKLAPLVLDNKIQWLEEGRINYIS